MLSDALQFFRFVTPHRSGKWYPDLSQARKQAAAIGDGYLDARTGTFIAYRGTRLETREGDQRFR